jgi:hypothetical protein
MPTGACLGQTQRHRALLTLLVASVVLLVVPAGSAQPRIVAVGDVHGDFDALVAILQRTRLIDAKYRWIAEKTTLVQTGDLIDRGPKPREVMDLLMGLEKQVPKKGGRVLVLLGDHEVMNLIGDLRYVTAENYSSFADKESEWRRQAAYREYVNWLAQRARALKQPPPVITPETAKQWMETHPLGFVEHRQAYAPQGKYGRWLRRRPAVVQLGETIFLHGGLSPELRSWKVGAINNRVFEEIKSFDEAKQYLVDHKIILPFFTFEEIVSAVMAERDVRKAAADGQAAVAAKAGKTFAPTAAEKQELNILEALLRYPGWFSIHPDGPLWFRGFALWSEQEGAKEVSDLLGSYRVSHFVVGHTPQNDGRIRARFGGKVFVIDTGMLASYFKGGRASALEIWGRKFTALYFDGEVELFQSSAARRSSSRSGGITTGGGLPAPSPGLETSEAVLGGRGF